MHKFLARVEVLVWNSEAAKQYAHLRKNCDEQGRTLGNMDMLIAAHAIAADRVLVTNDQAFHGLKDAIVLANWIK